MTLSSLILQFPKCDLILNEKQLSLLQPSQTVDTCLEILVNQDLYTLVLANLIF